MEVGFEKWKDRLTNLEDALRDVYPFIKVTHAEIEETVNSNGLFTHRLGPHIIQVLNRLKS